MFNILLFVMVTALFIHTFMNCFLKIYSYVVSKVAGVAEVEHSLEVFFGKIFSGILNFFKKL